MQIDQVASSEILNAVRPFLPELITVRRRGSRLLVKYKPARFESIGLSTPSFGHIRRRQSSAGALTVAYRTTLSDLAGFVDSNGLSWNGLPAGLAHAHVKVVDGTVQAYLTGSDATVLTLPTLTPALAAISAAGPAKDPGGPTIRRSPSLPAVPEIVAQRIVDAITAAMPPDLSARLGHRAVTFTTDGHILGTDRTAKPTTGWPVQFTPRNRDGVSASSVAWAACYLLDGLLSMSRFRGTPIDRGDAKIWRSYAQVQDGYLHCWLAEPGHSAAVTLAPINLTGLIPQPPVGIRLPKWLPLLHRLPAPGEVITARPVR